MKVAVVGAGRIALEHFGALRTLGDVEVVVCDRSPAAAESAADRFDLASWYVDYEEMLRLEQPGFVHVTTPATTHVPLARSALESGAHVLVEKPVAIEYADWLGLRELALANGRWLLEDHAYQFSAPVSKVHRLVEEGEFGDVVHVEVTQCLDIHSEESGFSDPNAPHPSLALPGGAISDFLTHLAYLCWIFLGEHEEVEGCWWKRNPDSLSPHDEMRALVRAKAASAGLAFSASGRPQGLFLRVYGTRMRAEMNLFENTLRLDRVRPGPSPLTPFWNGLRGGWSEAAGGVQSLWSKLSGRPGACEGVWQLIRRTYTALQRGEPPPIGLEQIDGTNRLVRDLLAERAAS
jgi:predicted dehydrogenase